MINTEFLFQTVDHSVSGYKKKFTAFSIKAEIHLVISFLSSTWEMEKESSKLSDYEIYTVNYKTDAKTLSVLNTHNSLVISLGA